MPNNHDQWKYALIERHITKGIVHFVPPYTLFELELDNGCRYVGLAQQGHSDEWSERIGYDVAYGRAMQQAMKCTKWIVDKPVQESHDSQSILQQFATTYETLRDAPVPLCVSMWQHLPPVYDGIVRRKPG